MTPILLDLALKAGFSDPIEGWMGEAYEERLEAFAKLIIEHEASKQEPVAWQVMVEDEAMEEFSVKDAAHDWCVQQKLAGSPYSYWIRPLYTTPPAQEFVCSTGLCHFTLTQTNVGIGERGMEAYEAAKERGWVGVSDERLMEMPKREWVGLTDEEIEKGRDQTFSINNPYCPCDSKTMRKAVRWAEAKLKEKNT